MKTTHWKTSGSNRSVVDLGFDANAHRSSGACDNSHSHLFIVGVKVSHLELSYVTKLVLRQNASFVSLGVCCASGDSGCSLDKICCKRLLDLKRVRSVLENSDLDGHHESKLRSGLLVELL